MSAKVAPPRPSEEPESPLSRRLLEMSGFLLNKAAQKAREHYEESLKPLGLSSKHAGLMIAIDEKGLLTQQQIGRCLVTDRSTMVQLIDDLEKMGHVQRQSIPEDRRAHAIALTAQGRKILPEVIRLCEAGEKKFLSCIPAAERKALVQLLKPLVLAYYGPAKPLEGEP
jgi:DNA-binding MarR family transcriptional regulator